MMAQRWKEDVETAINENEGRKAKVCRDDDKDDTDKTLKPLIKLLCSL